LQDARQVFDKLVKKNVSTWTTMLGRCNYYNRLEDALKLFNQMCDASVQSDVITYISILKACTNPILALKWGKEMHTHISFHVNVWVGNALLKMYVKLGRLEDAQ
jgi:pentatricopeptide repeat protein